ncbi:MAG: hypothetical protein ACK4TB_03465 [Gemmobacter sp.]
MTRALTILRAGPGVTVQDMGRPGWRAQGLSQGGAADPLALAEAAALLGQGPLAAVEIAASYLEVAFDASVRVALTGAPMRAEAAGALAWNAAHALPAGARLALSGSPGGYSYLHVGGGIGGAVVLGAVSAHLAAGIGRGLAAGDRLHLGPDPGGAAGLALTPLARQAPPGVPLRFRFVPLDKAVALERAEARRRAALRADLRPLRRDPRATPDLLAYQLIGGVTRGDDLDRP